MGKVLGVLYGAVAYAIFFGAFLYAIAFVGDLPVPKTIDSGAAGAVLPSLIVDALLLGLFAVQHSVMARPAFKAWWTRIVPPSVERSTYVLFSSLVLILLFWQWRPMPQPVWTIGSPAVGAALLVLGAAGWLMVLSSTFLINHFDLFGLRQVWLQFRGRPYTYLSFKTPGPYRLVRHPLYVGWFFAFWCTPTMSAAHLVFALMTTAYILIAIRLEERDLVDALPEYAKYRRRVPMLVPGLGGAPATDAGVAPRT